jgi:hypothetical protein
VGERIRRGEVPRRALVGFGTTEKRRGIPARLRIIGWRTAPSVPPHLEPFETREHLDDHVSDAEVAFIANRDRELPQNLTG